jgi:hypothetical protein
MSFKRKRRKTQLKLIGKQQRLHRTANRMRERRLWRRDNEQV